MSQKDQLYSSNEARVGSFVFDSRVAAVFDDMISRSVPGYQQILHLLPTLTRYFRRDNATYYDLGCSLGAGLVAMSQGLEKNNATLVGVDNSSAMLKQAEENMKLVSHQRTSLIEEDVLQVTVENAAMVLMNFTLQFIPSEHRSKLLESIYHGLHSGGVLVLSEKLAIESNDVSQLMTEIHHQYKRDQGYSDLEISRKRDAIEKVLIPDTLETHLNRLYATGFSKVFPWLQNLQFVSLLAIK